MIKNISLFYDKTKKPAVDVARHIKKMNVHVNTGKITSKTQLAISIGGDGMVLKTAREAVMYGVPVASIGLGRLGFLTVKVKDCDEYIKFLLGGKFAVEERVMLAAEKFIALNDIVIKNGQTARLINLEVFIGGKKMYDLRGDGIIISTPTGSTAYSLAAGGPVVEPGLKVMIITPLNPHSFSISSRPVVVGDTVVEIRCTSRYDEVILTADGQVSEKLRPGTSIKINILHKKVKLVAGSETFFNRLVKKLC